MSEYNSKPVGDSTEFTTTPGKVPYPIVLVAIPGVLLVLIALSMGFLYGLVAAGFVYGAMYLLMHSKQATLHRVPATFRVSQAGVEQGGAVIARENIHRVIMRNHVLDAAAGVIVGAMLKQLNEPVGDTKNAAPIAIKYFKKQGCDAPTPRGYNCFFTMQVDSSNSMAQMFNNVPSSVFHKEGGKWEAYPPF
jgi:hypothetical protein